MKRRHNRSQGFTIVELLIVIVVIAILATVAIVSYNGIIQRTKIAVITSDLSGAYKQLASDNINSGTYPASATAANGGQGLKASSGTVLAYALYGKGYCLTATNGSLRYKVNSNNNVAVLGDCSAGLNNGVVSTFAGSGDADYADGPGSTASFFLPAALARDVSGAIYVADQGNQRIRKISAYGVVSTLAGSGTQGYVEGTGTAAFFSNPSGIAVDSNGFVYVSDQGNRRIRKISPLGVVFTFAGTGIQGNADGAGTIATFGAPMGIAVDASGNAYVADIIYHQIRKISPSGVVSTLAGSGTSGFANGTGTAAAFFYPSGIAVDSSNNVYVADQGNHRIRKITPTGVVSTLAGSGAEGNEDGPASTASFFNPTDVGIDVSGNIYVADYSNHRIRIITPGGVVATLAGSGAEDFAEGTGTAAAFNGTAGVIVDPDGNVYVSDYYNNRIRKIQ